MSEIRVSVGQQQNAVKVIASSSGSAAGKLAVIATDVNTADRADRTFLMFDAATQTYIHIDAAQIVDLADSVDNEAYDAGTF